MAFRKTEAITLFRRDYSETSQVIIFYTADYGKILVLARGNKRPKHSQLEPIDLLAHSEIVFLDKTPKGLHLLTEYTLKDGFPGLRERLERIYQGIYLAEFLDELTEAGDSNRGLFNLTLETLKRLQNSSNGLEPLFYFESLALKYLGFIPRLITDLSESGFRCGLCNNRIGDKPNLRFSSRHGGVLCDRCSPGNETIAVTPGILRIIMWCAGESRFNEAEPRLKVSLKMQQELRGFLDYYIASIVGRELNTAKWLTK